MLLNKEKYISIIIFLATTFFLYSLISKDVGNFIYFWDDPYIHMAVAESLVKNGFPSADGYSISMASSSPLWTLILASFYWIMDKTNTINEFILVPFALNVFFGILTLFVASKIKTEKIKFSSYIVLLAAPLPIVVFVGMEHMLQIFLTSMLIYLSLEYINTKNSKIIKYFIITSMVAAFTRYELFVFANVLLIFTLINDIHNIKDKINILIDKKNVILKMIIASFIPILITGIYLKSQGLFFLPDSVVAKSISGGEGVVKNIQHNLAIYFNIKSIILPLLFPIISAYFAFFLEYLKKQDLKTAPIAYALGFMALFHILFAGPAFLRYDAYISAFSLIPILEYVLLSKEKAACKLGAMFLSFFMIVAGTLILTRDILGTYGVLIGSKNIHDQQIQSARFVNIVNQEKTNTIALNDLGAVAFFTNSKIIDMVGLGTHEIAVLIKNGGTSGDDLKKEIIKNNVDWAIYYPNWFEKEQSSIREVCKPIGELQLKRNFICGGNKVVYDYCGNDLNQAKLDFKKFTSDVKRSTNNRVEIVKTP